MALITASAARAYIPSLSDGDSTQLDDLIAKADVALAHLCGYPMYGLGTRSMEAQTYTLYLDGPGGRELYLPPPIQSVTSIHDDELGAWGSDTEVDSGDWTLFANEGLVRLNVSGGHGAWSTARRAIKVVASLGYSTVPDGLKHAAGLWVAHAYRNTIPSLGKSSITQREATVALVTSAFPPEVKQAAAPFVWWRGKL